MRFPAPTGSLGFLAGPVGDHGEDQGQSGGGQEQGEEAVDPVELVWPRWLVQSTRPPLLAYLDLNHWRKEELSYETQI